MEDLHASNKIICSTQSLQKTPCYKNTKAFTPKFYKIIGFNHGEMAIIGAPSEVPYLFINLQNMKIK